VRQNSIEFMAIHPFRAKPASNYTIIANDALRDKRLSLKARGLVATCLSHDDTKFSITVEGLAATCANGRDSIIAALKELRKYGYAREMQERDPKSGLILGHHTDVADHPVKEWLTAPSGPQPENPIMDHRQPHPQTENPFMDHRQPHPQTENPEPENPKERNINSKEISTISSISCTPPERERLELFFHSVMGYAAGKQIADELISSRDAVGWVTNAGREITDKVSYARLWKVRDELGMRIWDSDAAKAAYHRLYEAVKSEPGVALMTSIEKVSLVDNYVVMTSNQRDLLLAWMRENKSKWGADIQIKIL